MGENIMEEKTAIEKTTDKTADRTGGREDRQPPVVRLGRELKYQGTILKIYEDRVLANGHECRWDFIHHDGAAAVIPVTAQGKILMVRQYRNALDRFTLEVPAGKLDRPDEPTLECAARELEEETGYRAGTLEFLISVNTTIAFCDEHIDVYLARDLQPSHQHLDEDEVIQVEEWTLEDLEEMIFTGRITDAKTMAAILAYARKYRSLPKDEQTKIPDAK